MLKISICPAVVEDAAAIAALNESCLGKSFPVSSVQAQLKTILRRTDEKLLVAVYRGQPIGYIHARDDLSTYRAPRKMILALAVDKEYRRHGVGTALMDAVAAWAKETRCEAIGVTVGSSKAAQSFFTAYGCEERLNRKPFYKSIVDPKSTILERLENSYGKKE